MEYTLDADVETKIERTIISVEENTTHAISEIKFAFLSGNIASPVSTL